MKRRGSILLSKEKPRNITQDYAVDQFGELPSRKRAAGIRARQLGHDMGGWRRRSNDPAGRWNSFCATCNQPMVVCTETPAGFTDAYGPALTNECSVVKGVTPC